MQTARTASSRLVFEILVELSFDVQVPPQHETEGRVGPPLPAGLHRRTNLRVSSGTYVRAIAEALGGHCRTLRRTEVGPFSVADAVLPDAFEPSLLLPESVVLERVGVGGA